MAYKLITANCLDALRAMPDNSVHCVVTSPPYYGLREYSTAKWEGGDTACDHLGKPIRTKAGFNERYFGKQFATDKQGEGLEPMGNTCSKCGAQRVDEQIGLENTPEAYVANLVTVMCEVRRVLREDGTTWVVLGDSYAGSGTGGGGNRKGNEHGQHDVMVSTGRPDVPHGLKPKDLIGIPWRVALALQADGWWLRSDIIYSKSNPLPESVTDRCTKSHEYIFMLTKTAKYYYDADAIREPSTKQNGLAANFRRTTKDHLIPGQDAIQHRLDRESTSDSGYRNKRDVWTVATRGYPGSHFAVFPEALITPCILAGTSEAGVCPVCGKPWRRVIEKHETVGWKDQCECSEERDTGGVTPWGDFISITVAPDPVPATVLDPFSGAGTTGVVCARHNRDYIGIDLNEEYNRMANERIQKVQTA